MLHVSDTGIGIPAEELPRLFERFHRVESPGARSGEGSGIGLALVRELVRLHGGDIRADSELGEGTTFTVRSRSGRRTCRPSTVAPHERPTGPAVSAGAEPSSPRRCAGCPAARSATDAELPAARGAAASRPAGRRTRAACCVADDNADMREYVRRLLAAALRRARRGRRARRRWRRRWPTRRTSWSPT